MSVLGSLRERRREEVYLNCYNRTPQVGGGGSSDGQHKCIFYGVGGCGVQDQDSGQLDALTAVLLSPHIASGLFSKGNPFMGSLYELSTFQLVAYSHYIYTSLTDTLYSHMV